MPIDEKTVRQSVSLPAHVARRVKSLAKTSSKSANRIIVDPIESGIEAGSGKGNASSSWLTACRSSDVKSRNVREELARMTFGE
jgi:hypothetical protein